MNRNSDFSSGKSIYLLNLLFTHEKSEIYYEDWFLNRNSDFSSGKSNYLLNLLFTHEKSEMNPQMSTLGSSAKISDFSSVFSTYKKNSKFKTSNSMFWSQVVPNYYWLIVFS